MAIYRGFLRSIETRENGWVETTLVAVHAGNGERGFLIRSVDGDLEQTNRRLAQLGLLRDALARSLPVEVNYDASDEVGDVIRDVTVYQRPSFEGRPGDRVIRGVVIGLAVSEHDTTSAASPYRDDADLANVTLLTDAGSVEGLILDLQRPDPMTAQAILGLLRSAHASRRTVEVLVATAIEGRKGDGLPAFVRSCRLPPLAQGDLTFVHAFIERLGQRSESWDAAALDDVDTLRVVFTTAPDQSPEGDVSENGSFIARTHEARLHVDSPLVDRLQAALREGLQVRLGLAVGDRLVAGEDAGNDGGAKDAAGGRGKFFDEAKVKIHIESVELVCPLGSAARPVWVENRLAHLPAENPETTCDGTPTIQTPDHRDLSSLPCSIAWTGEGWFAKGIWRLVVIADGPVELTIDGETPCRQCGEQPLTDKSDKLERLHQASPEGYSGLARARLEARAPLRRCVYHAYLDGLHEVATVVRERTCASPFRLHVHRIR